MSEPSSLLIKGGTVVGHHQRHVADVLVEDGLIAAVAAPGYLTAHRTVDVTGLYVLPGLVDAHVHVRDPGYLHKEDLSTATMAAVAGGVTSVLVMPYDDPLTDTARALAEKALYSAGRSFAHFGLQAAVGPGNAGSVGALVKAGAVSLEVQMAEAPPAVGVPDHYCLLGILSEARESGAIVGIYCEDDALASGRRTALTAAGRRDPAAFAESKSPVGEAISVAAVTSLALEAQAAIHLRQVSTRAALQAARAARAAGADVSIEVTPHHLSLTLADEIRGGPAVKVSPPLRSDVDVIALRGALADGTVDMVATDHAPHAQAEKEAGRDDIWLAPGGFPGLETLFPVMFEILGVEGLETIVRVCSYAPAKRFGLAGKGAILPGYVADLIVVDPSVEWVPTGALLHTKAKSTPYAGHRFTGDVKFAMVAGEIVAEDRRIVGGARGQWLRPTSV